MDEKPYRYENLPIPTYEEATSSHARPGPQEVGDQTESQGLLGGNDREPPASRRSNYEAPTVESERSSFDSLDGLDNEDEEAEVRREMQEMDIEEPDSDNGSHRSLLTYRFKRLTSFTNSFTSLSLPSFRRFIPSFSCCTIDWQSAEANRIVILGRLFGIFLIVGVVYALIATDILNLGRNRMGGGRMYEPESVRSYVQNGFKDRTQFKNHYEHITQFPHLAGTEGSYVLAEWIAELFKQSELEDVYMERFDIYMNFPQKGGRQLEITEPAELKWQARVEEVNEKIAVFQGYAQAGTVTGPLIYANFGTPQDYQILKDKGVSVEGAVVLVRRHATQEDQGTKVKAAQDAGAKGCIVFSDPSQNGHEDGSLPSDGVQRGSVSLIAQVIGDPLTPGWASTPSFRQRLRLDETTGLVRIPSLPISWDDGSHLLKVIQKHGFKMDGDWAGTEDMEYWTGDNNSPKVTLKNLQDEEFYQPVYNVLGRITGWEQPEKKIIVGNHRDSWCAGAASPGSGTAIMLAMIKIFGDLRALNWQPLRTIEFVSWDAGEFNCAGSAEHVENRIQELMQNGVAYLNVGAGISGKSFSASASPMLQASLHRAIARVNDPNLNDTEHPAVSNHFAGITAPGARGDLTPFQHMTGISSIDMSFQGLHYPEGSCYDNLEWINEHGDPDNAYETSASLGQIWALMILELSDSLLVPLDVRTFCDDLKKYVDNITNDLRALHAQAKNAPSNLMAQVKPLHASIDFLRLQVQQLERFDNHWHNMIYGSGGYETSALQTKRKNRNSRVINFESKLLLMPNKTQDLSPDAVHNAGGLPGRSQYKHAIFAPLVSDPLTAEIFPSIRYYMASGDWDKIFAEVAHVAQIITDAASELSV